MAPGYTVNLFASEVEFPELKNPVQIAFGAGGPLQPGFLGGFMGPTFDPFWVLNNPDAIDFHVDNLALPAPVTPERMNDRSRLLSDLGRGLKIRNEPSLTAIDDFQSRAFELLTSDAAQQAFDIGEPKIFGQCLYVCNECGVVRFVGLQRLQALAETMQVADFRELFQFVQLMGLRHLHRHRDRFVHG